MAQWWYEHPVHIYILERVYVCALWYSIFQFDRSADTHTDKMRARSPRTHACKESQHMHTNIIRQKSEEATNEQKKSIYNKNVDEVDDIQLLDVCDHYAIIFLCVEPEDVRASNHQPHHIELKQRLFQILVWRYSSVCGLCVCMNHKHSTVCTDRIFSFGVPLISCVFYGRARAIAHVSLLSVDPPMIDNMSDCRF